VTGAIHNRRALLTAALGFAQLPPRAPALGALHAWLDSWTGLGLVVVGMERHGFALSLHKMHGDGWRASFYGDAMTSAAGFAAAPTPWAAVQRAAWMALKPTRPL
jgi:hypothetical protein